MLSTIRARIALLLASLMLVLLVGLGVYLYFSLQTQLHSAMDRQLAFSAHRLLNTLDELETFTYCSFDPTSNQTRAIFDSEDLARMVTSMGAPLDTRGEEGVAVPTASLNARSGWYTVRFYEETIEALPDDLYPFVLFEEHDPSGEWRIEEMRLFSQPVTIGQGQLCYLQIGENLRPLKRTLQKFLLLMALACPVVLTITGFSSYWLAGQALRPIERIRQQAMLISAHDLSQRLNLSGTNDEVGRLAQTFDQMLERLEQSFQRQRQFTSDASHELRTPLAIIRGVVDVTLEHPRPTAEYIATLRSVNEEAERMARLVGNLLWLSRRDQAKLPLNCEQLDLTTLLTVLLEQMHPQADAAQVQLQAELTEPLWLNGDPDRLLQLFINLLENAFAYAPGSQVKVGGSVQKDYLQIIVADTGPGIAAEHLPRLFERFYRVDKARSRVNGGSGLGLAIAQEIAQAHAGKIMVASQLGQGTTFTVYLLKGQ